MHFFSVKKPPVIGDNFPKKLCLYKSSYTSLFWPSNNFSQDTISHRPSAQKSPKSYYFPNNSPNEQNCRFLPQNTSKLVTDSHTAEVRQGSGRVPEGTFEGPKASPREPSRVRKGPQGSFNVENTSGSTERTRK